jgi:hypothetical protein
MGALYSLGSRESAVTRTARFPFSFGQQVVHPAFPLPFVVVAQECDKIGDWTISVTDRNGGGWWRYPANELTFRNIVDEQEAMAEWMGCSVERMNVHHDRLHRWIAERVGLPSFSLRRADGEHLSPDENALAAAEEDAVLHVQKYLVASEHYLQVAA